MSALLHPPDALRDLAGGPPGAARDWALAALARRGLPVPGLPDDPAAARLALAAGAPLEPVLARLRAARPSELPEVAGLLEDVAAFGRLPEDREPWRVAIRSAIQGRGRATDLRLAAVLAGFGDPDPAALQAAARVEDAALAWLLPGLVVRWAAHAGRDVDAAAAEVAKALAARRGLPPRQVRRVLSAVGIPQAAPDRPLATLEEALYLGGTLAGVDETPAVSPGRGSAKLRMRGAIRELLADAPADPARALVGALAAVDLPEPGDLGLLVAAAVWLRTAPRGDALEAVLGHAAGEDPAVLAAAARRVPEIDPAALGLALATRWHADPPAAALVGPVLARRPLAAERPAGADPAPPLRDLAEAVVTQGAHALDEPRHQTAVALALARTDAVLRWFAGGGTAFALYHARHVATEAVLEQLLGLDPPAEPHHRAWVAAALAEMGDRGAASALDRLAARFPDEPALAAEQARARAILGG